MNYDYFKLYLKKMCGAYQEPIRYRDYNVLINDLDKYYHDFFGCMIVARDEKNRCDIPICTKEFQNGKEVYTDVYNAINGSEETIKEEKSNDEIIEEESNDEEELVFEDLTTHKKIKKKKKIIIRDEKKIIKRLARRKFGSLSQKFY